ncbi:MAG: hypothetical protein KJ720_02755 [Proteobacteria bacterium]|nr:hypothetical protein [Pseudomonadota bacterium]MBU1452826.1 hypothetical protein [Pseudomonadota bacterium]MBU2467349.1 hypothetical protein [Pseudomonadota bacterium]MBU2518041.1 hypothetical protein [Pseudomonadota bacterium]
MPLQAESKNRLAGWLLESALALWVAASVCWLWPRLDLPRLGHEQVWFSLGWVCALGLSAAWRALWPQPRDDGAHHLLRASTCSSAALGLGLVFVVLLAGAGGLGNYKLWLGIVYLGGVTLSLASLTLRLRSEISARPEGELSALLAGAAISFTACLLVLPWVRPDLTALWPPPAGELLMPLASAALWGGVAGATLPVVRLLGGSRRLAWIVFLAVGLGPGPALAVSWFPLAPLAGVCAIMVGLAALRLISPRSRRQAAMSGGDGAGPRPLSFYWLLRSLMLIWWGVGAAVTLTAAWWYPRVGAMFTDAVWLRAIALGAFMVTCVGLLAEYAQPLLGRGESPSPDRNRKVAGIFCSVLAFLAALSPFLLMLPPGNAHLPSYFADGARAVLLREEVVLGPHNPEVELKPPTWLTGLSRVFVISLLSDAAQVEQGQVVAQLIATDEQDLPHIYQIRAGIDTAEWDLDKRETSLVARHRPGRLASTWIVYTASGEAFMAHDFFTGLYLGRRVERLTSVRLRYLYKNPPGKPPATLVLRKVFLY